MSTSNFYICNNYINILVSLNYFLYHWYFVHLDLIKWRLDKSAIELDCLLKIYNKNR